MTVTLHEIRSGAYYDSVVLMQLQRALADLPGVVDAGVVMATPANCELLQQSDLLPAEASTAGNDDLLIVVRAADEKSAQAALTQVDDLLARRRSSTAGTFRPRSLDAAAKMLPDARWVLISVPGRYAADVARDALTLGKHVFLYSDNVSMEDEIDLKQRARDKGLLVMGPDCGTALVGGIGLGFANRVRRGPIGLVGASGTGLQAITSEIHTLGQGITHAIGTGGRDLKAEVGAITMKQGIDLLARDLETEVIVLVSKPPDPAVVVDVLIAAQASNKPTVVCFLGYAPPATTVGSLNFALNLHEAAEMAVGSVGTQVYLPAATHTAPKSGRRYLRGLFSGGTLASDTLRALSIFLHPLYSNVAFHPSQALADPLVSQAHTILDLGEDEFTVGRLHPMMDNDLRIRRLKQEAADPEVALILLDVVLGEGAHHNPAGELAPAIEEAIKEYGVEVIVFIVGTDEDPQDMASQMEHFEAAGATVTLTTADTADLIRAKLGKATPAPSSPVSLDDMSASFSAINVGVETFYDSLIGQGAQAVHVDWRPPAGGDDRLAAILAKMKG